MNPRSAILRAAMIAAVTIAAAAGAARAEEAVQPRLVHRFQRVIISPNGEFVASIEGDAPLGGSQPVIRDLVIRRISNGVATRVDLPCGRVPQCWPGTPAWTSDGRRLSFTLRTPGSHARSIYSVAADGSGLDKLLEFAGTIEELRYGPGGRLAMLATENAVKEVGATEAGAPVAGDLDAPPAEQRIAILEPGGLQWVSPADLFVYEYDWRPDGSGFVGTAAPGNGDDHWWTAKLYAFPVSAGPAQLLYSPVDNQQQIAAPRVARDGRRVAFIAGIMSDFGSTGGDVYTLPLAAEPAAATPALDLMPLMAASATDIDWTCDGHVLARLLAGDHTEFADLGSGAVRITAPHRVWSGTDSVRTRADGDAFACPSSAIAVTRESYTSPPEIEVGRLGAWRRLTGVNAGLHMPLQVKSIWWKSDGADVQGWLLLPLGGAGKRPMITIVHGGPSAASVPGFAGPGLNQALLERGYALFLPNPRGSFGQGERFTLANVRDFGHGDLRDILAGVDAAAAAAPIDTERLGVMGGSYGGFMTMWTVTQTTRFKAAVAAAGISDWLSYYGENGIDAWLLPFFGASVYDDPDAYARSSPINFIRNVRTPTFAYVGERDIECPAAQTQEFWHALKVLGIATSVMIYPGEGHGLRDPEHIADAQRRTLAWFQTYLN